MKHDFEYRMVDPRTIRFDGMYQRELDNKRVEKIVKNWNDDVFNAPKVSLRDGVLWCFDGMHSTVAWLKKFGNKPMPCKVYKGLTWLDECNLFIEQTGISKALSTNAQMHAAYNANKQDVVMMVRGAEAAGFAVNFKNQKNNDKTIVAVGALLKSLHELGYAEYCKLMNVIAQAWPDYNAATRQIIGALTLIFKVYMGKFDPEELAKRLGKKRPEYYTGSTEQKSVKEYARVMLREYNKKRTTRRLDVELIG